MTRSVKGRLFQKGGNNPMQKKRRFGVARGGSGGPRADAQMMRNSLNFHQLDTLYDKI